MAATAARRPAVARGRRGSRAAAVLVLGALLWADLPGSVVAAGQAPDLDEGAEQESSAEELAEAARVAERQTARRRLRDAEAVLAAARATLRTARSSLQAARAAGSRADGQVRRTEAVLPPLVLARRSAIAEVEAVLRDIERVRHARVDAEQELEVATAALARQALRTFKTGSAADLTGPIAIVREARDPGQLARGLADLRAVTRDNARSVRAVEAELVALDAELADLRLHREVLVAQVAAAEETLLQGEDSAASARAAAGAEEARVIAAMEAELAADRAVQRAEERRDRRRVELAELDVGEGIGPRSPNGAVGPDRPSDRPGEAGPDGADGVDGTEVEADDLDDRSEAVLGRRRALQRADRLSPSQRRTAESWVCPLDGARFVNDWAYPRSGGRRHEGTDVFAPRGTPIVAVADGTVDTVVTFDRPGSLGGRTVTVVDGAARQYYAHLEGVTAGLRRGDLVRAGDLLGWVGTSGNARGTPPHLHLGWYVEDVAVNPFASLAVACDEVRGDDGDVRARRGDGDGRAQGWRVPSPARIAW
ncbi:M23 family metallopeptidase [Nitriliruptor alkaliphilus]|uniref:M23 family metallopeptidase n=1 Tax=Nitriliruptor alkaliphilus TaxID=427918 RepID=UPI0006981773|nr:M23 family metallopeptidase [Nitriliruptor alkaliphilus]